MSQNFVVPRHKWQERSNTKHACGENTKYSVCNLPCNNSVNMSFAHCNTCVCVLLIRALVFTVHIRRHFGQTEDFQRKSSSSVSFEGLFQSTIVTFSRYHTLEDRVLTNISLAVALTFAPGAPNKIILFTHHYHLTTTCMGGKITNHNYL